MENQLEKRLNRALMDEYHARNSYRQIIAAFGPVRPFSNIVEAEQTHINLLLPLYEKYSIPVPAEPKTAAADVPESLEQACRIAVQAEEDNIALYDELLSATDEPDVIAVFKQLQAASRDHHLPAFRRSLARGTNQPMRVVRGSGQGRVGRGRGRGYGNRRGRGCRFV